jgi:hypothetical protein
MNYKYKTILLINTRELPCSGTLIYTFKKFCIGFEQNGLNLIEINSLSDGLSKYNNQETIVLLSNVFSNLSGYQSISDLLPNSNFILFHFTSLITQNLISEIPFKKYILTGEHYLNEPKSSIDHLNVHNFNKNCERWIPFIFASSIHPNDVGKEKNEIIYDSIFIGSKYKQDWVSSLNNHFNDLSNYLDESDRIQKYLSSRVCLGFHSDANILNSCITERVFEGMAYGCAVISDNKSAESFTNGIVKYVESLSDVIKYISLYKENVDIYNQVRDNGYEYIKNCGTYYHKAINFMKKFDELYY